MSTTVIGGITLDTDPYWEDEYTAPVTAGADARTLSGERVLQAFLVIGGRDFTLGGDDSHAWQKKSTVDSLKALSRSKIGQSFSVTYRGTTYSCMFRYGDENPVDYTPVLPLEAPTASSWYFGRIKLLIVDQP